MQLQSIAAILEYTHIHLYIYVQWEFLETLKRRDYTTDTIFLGYILLHTPYQSTLHIGTSNLDLRTAVVFWMIPVCLVLLGCLSHLIPILKRNKLTWEWRKVISCWAQRQRQRNGGNGNGTARSPRKNIWCTTIVLAERLSDPYFWCTSWWFPIMRETLYLVRIMIAVDSCCDGLKRTKRHGRIYDTTWYN